MANLLHNADPILTLTTRVLADTVLNYWQEMAETAETSGYEVTGPADCDEGTRTFVINTVFARVVDRWYNDSIDRRPKIMHDDVIHALRVAELSE